MKKLLSLLLIGVIVLFSGCRVHAAPENRVTPPFFKITDPETGGVVYLLGTMHIGIRNTVYPDEIYAALDECSALAVEIDLQALEADQRRLSDAMRLLECQGETAADYLGGEYPDIKKFFRKNRIYNSNLEKYIPSVWSSLLSNKLSSDCGYFSEYGTDRAMLAYAKEHSIEIIELETVEEQYQINANEPRRLQIYSLASSVHTDQKILKEQMKELYRAWSENDGAAIERMLYEDEIPEELSEEFAEYYYMMYESRQEKMAEFIQNTLDNGEKAVVAVGAMHCFATPDIFDFLDENVIIKSVSYSD